MEKFKDIIEKLYYERKKILIISILVMLSLSIFIFYRKEDKKEEISLVKEESKKEEVFVENKIIVDIKGEVKNPGCFEVSDALRIKDVIDLAGGLTENADTSNINLGSKVHDEMVIIIDKKEDVKEVINNEEGIKVETKTNNMKTNNTTKTTGKISINKASVKELTYLSGIGEAKAKKIVDYREKNGPFKSIDDIKKVSGIGEGIFAKIKDYITL